MSKQRKLTKKQQAFVENMANPEIGTQTQAYQLAYRGVSNETAMANSSRLLRNAKVSEAILERKEKALAHHRVTPEEVLGSAVRQMRSSLDDVLDERGGFSIEKARATGAVDHLRKIEIEERIDKETGETVRRTKIEMLTNQDARKEVANYIGLEKFNNETKPTNEEKAVAILLKLLADGIDKQKAIPLLCEKYDVTAEVLECVEIENK